MIAVLGFWLFAISLYFILNKKASYRVIFISLPILLMLTLFSPFSASNIAKHSQQEKLKVLLSEIDGGEENLSLQYNISSSISYLYNEHGVESLFPIMPKVVTDYENREQNISNDNCTPIIDGSFSNYATKKLGFEYINQWQWEQHTQAKNSNKFKILKIPTTFTRLKNYDQDRQTEIKGYHWLLSFNYAKQWNNYPRYCPPANEEKVVAKRQYFIETNPNNIIIKNKKKDIVLATIEIKEFIDNIITIKQENNNTNLQNYYEPITVMEEEFTYLYSNNKLNVKLIFNTIEISQKDELIQYNGNILILKK